MSSSVVAISPRLHWNIGNINPTHYSQVIVSSTQKYQTHAPIPWRRSDLLRKIRLELTGHVPCLPTTLSGIVRCYRGWHLNKHNSAFAIDLGGSWMDSASTHTLRLRSPGSNSGCDKGYVPLRRAGKNKTHVSQLPSVRLTGGPEVCAWNVESTERRHPISLTLILSVTLDESRFVTIHLTFARWPSVTKYKFSVKCSLIIDHLTFRQWHMKVMSLTPLTVRHVFIRQIFGNCFRYPEEVCKHRTINKIH